MATQSYTLPIFISYQLFGYRQWNGTCINTGPKPNSTGLKPYRQPSQLKISKKGKPTGPNRNPTRPRPNPTGPTPYPTGPKLASNFKKGNPTGRKTNPTCPKSNPGSRTNPISSRPNPNNPRHYPTSPRPNPTDPRLYSTRLKLDRHQTAPKFQKTKPNRTQDLIHWS